MNSSLHFALPGYGMHGLGATAAQTGVSIGTTLAEGGSGVIAGATGLTAAIGAAAAIPIVGAAIAGIGIAIEAILSSGCGQTCIETSQWANQAEPLLQQNVEAYFAIAPPRPVAVQQAAMQNFQNVWNRLVQLCSQAGLGNAGKNCIADRQQGACKWKASSTGAYPGQPAQGQCWNWWNAYYLPISNDTQVSNNTIGLSPLTTTTSGTVNSIPAVSVSSSSDLLWIGAAVLGGLLLVTQL